MHFFEAVMSFIIYSIVIHNKIKILTSSLMYLFQEQVIVAEIWNINYIVCYVIYVTLLVSSTLISQCWKRLILLKSIVKKKVFCTIQLRPLLVPDYICSRASNSKVHQISLSLVFSGNIYCPRPPTNLAVLIQPKVCC